MTTDARSLARMYAATVGEVDGVRLLRPETVDAITSTRRTSPPYGVPSELLSLGDLIDAPMSLGFARPSRLTPLLGPRSFGHPGGGGSIGFADPDLGVGFGYVMNWMSNDPRRLDNLLAAVAKCTGPGA
jgi:CubicO group peptidase (beta-lactamase class C family)